MRRSLIPFALLVGACQLLPPPLAGNGPGAGAAATNSPATSAPGAMDGLPGARLLPGDALYFSAPAGTKAYFMLANPAAKDATVGLAVEPAAARASLEPVATTAPSELPSATPSDGGGGGDVLGAGFDPGFSLDPSGDGGAAVAGIRSLSDAVPALAVGAHMNFWINNGNTSLAGDVQHDCTLRAVTPNAYFFVDDQDAPSVTDAWLQPFVDAFEQQIRPGMLPVFGEQTKPGPDGESHLYVVYSSWIGTAPGRSGLMGYFWPRDPVAPSGSGSDVRQHANQKQVLFLSTALEQQPTVTALGTLAHEYQHLIMYDDKTRAAGAPRTEDTWLDEGMSMLAMDLGGFGLQHGDAFVGDEIANWERQPLAYSLVNWSSNPHGYSYGLSYMFCRYLLDRFGPTIVQEIHATPATGTAGLDQVLAKHGSSFTATFLDFAASLAPRPEGTGGPAPGFAWFDPAGRYGDTSLPGTQASTADAASSLAIRPWGAGYLELDGLEILPRALTLNDATAPLTVWSALEGGS